MVWYNVVPGIHLLYPSYYWNLEPVQESYRRYQSFDKLLHILHFKIFVAKFRRLKEFITFAVVSEIWSFLMVSNSCPGRPSVLPKKKENFRKARAKPLWQHQISAHSKWKFKGTSRVWLILFCIRSQDSGMGQLEPRAWVKPNFTELNYHEGKKSTSSNFFKKAFYPSRRCNGRVPSSSRILYVQKLVRQAFL